MGELNVHKVTLSSGKVVLLREVKIKDQELAAQAASSRAGEDNKLALAIGMQKEMLKMLIVQVDGSQVTPVQLEDLDAVFSYAEYMQLVNVLGKLTGDESLGNAQIELVTSGEQ